MLKAIMPPVVTRVTVTWPVCLSVCLSYSCTLLQLLNGMICYFSVWYTRVVQVSQETVSNRQGIQSLVASGDLGLEPSS